MRVDGVANRDMDELPLKHQLNTTLGKKEDAPNQEAVAFAHGALSPKPSVLLLTRRVHYLDGIVISVDRERDGVRVLDCWVPLFAEGPVEERSGDGGFADAAVTWGRVKESGNKVGEMLHASERCLHTKVGIPDLALFRPAISRRWSSRARVASDQVLRWHPH